MTRTYGQSRAYKTDWELNLAGWVKFLICGGMLVTTLARAGVGPAPSPVNFFTNVASRLLLSELNLNLTRIQVYPTNQYTPAVHRLLQVTANIYDATTTNVYPSIFRPLFSRDADGLGTNVFITGYVLQTDSITLGNETNTVVTPDLALPIDPFDLSIVGGPVINLATNVYGVPWVIGAKKGFPNFNEFSLESSFQISRKLQFTRNTNTTPFQYASNQMYIMSISNYYGVECWNSYTSSYPRTGTGPVVIMTRASMGIGLTNDAPGFMPMFRNFMASSVVSFNSWPGINNNLGLSSFVMPFGTNALVLWLTNSVYNYGPNTWAGYSPPYTPPCFIPTAINSSNYLNNGTPPLPHFGLLTTNRLQAAIIDYSAGPDQGRIIDYVQLNGLDGSRDLNAEIADRDEYGLWSTNLTNGLTMGVINQINYSRFGVPVLPAEDSDDGGYWSTTPIPGLPFTTPAAEMSYFNHFFGKTLTTPIILGGQIYIAIYTTTNLQAPYMPVRTRVQRLTWQVNDPLVHYLTSDLIDTMDDTNTQHILRWPDNIALLNSRYMPWGGSPYRLSNDPDFNTVNAYNLSIKDPLVWQSDNWDFPTNQLPGLNWIGRVHRGTPWQTVYLKAQNVLGEIQIINGIYNFIGTNTWIQWTGDSDANDAVAMAPVRDRHLVSLLAPVFNPNNPRTLFSVNNPNPDAWMTLLDGLTVLTNDLPDNQLDYFSVLQFDSLVISSNSPQASAIADAIQSARAARPGQFFRDIGDVLATQPLAEQSPFLNWNDAVQQRFGISDEAYEIIPSQLLPFLRADSIGSIASTGGPMPVQFTGYDGYAYAIQVSSNLVDWTVCSTNYPVNGTFGLTNFAAPDDGPRFYRSVLLP